MFKMFICATRNESQIYTQQYNQHGKKTTTQQLSVKKGHVQYKFQEKIDEEKTAGE